MASASEYSEDAQRIERDYVNPESTSRAEVEADLEAADFANPDEVGEWVTSAEDVGITPETAHTDGITTREQVEAAVEQADEVGYSSDRREALTDTVSRDVGAPSQSDLQRAQIQTLAQESVTPSEVIEGDTRTSQISVVRNQQGEAVAAIGGGGSAGEDVAQELGATHYSSPQSYNDSMTAKPAPGGRKALLYSDGEAVGEVDL